MSKDKKAGFAFGKENYRLLIIGVVLLAIGFIMMVGGGSEDPTQFNPEIFSTRRITVAPIVVLAGFGVVLIAVLKKSKE